MFIPQNITYCTNLRYTIHVYSSKNTLLYMFILRIYRTVHVISHNIPSCTCLTCIVLYFWGLNIVQYGIFWGLNMYSAVYFEDWICTLRYILRIKYEQCGIFWGLYVQGGIFWGLYVQYGIFLGLKMYSTTLIL
jgi:hypothetical protein